jgi:hypothetical protein
MIQDCLLLLPLFRHASCRIIFCKLLNWALLGDMAIRAHTKLLAIIVKPFEIFQIKKFYN